MEDKIGSLEEGKYADFIILNENPLEVPIENLHEVRCVEAFVSGNRLLR